MKKAIEILIDYLTCTDPVIKTKWLNLLASFWHKDSGYVVKTIEVDEEGTTNFTFLKGDDTEEFVVIEKFVLPNEMPQSFITGLENALSNKVDKVTGKQLSTQDFTTSLKSKLEQLQNYVHPEFHQISEVQGLPDALESKQDKEAGKGLSTEDLTTELKALIQSALQRVDVQDLPDSPETELPASANQVRLLNVAVTNILNLLNSDDVTLDELQEVVDFIKANREDLQNLAIANIAGLVDALAAKVDVVAGKALSTNDFTDAYKEQLDNPPASVITIQDGDGIEQFKITDLVKFKGAQFDPATKEVDVNPKIVPQVGVTEVLEIGANALNNKYYTDAQKLVIRQILGNIGSTPTLFEISVEGERNNWTSQLHLKVDNGSAQVTALELLYNLVKTSLPISSPTFKSTEGLEVLKASTTDKSVVSFNDSTYGHRFGIIAGVGANNDIKVLKIRNEGYYGGRTSITQFINKNTSGSDTVVLELSANGGGQSIFKGSVKMDALDLSVLGSYADDTAAAAGGVAVGYAYINSATGAVHRRLT